MEDEAGTVAAVQCSVIQYCSDTTEAEPETCGNQNIIFNMKNIEKQESEGLINGDNGGIKEEPTSEVEASENLGNEDSVVKLEVESKSDSENEVENANTLSESLRIKPEEYTLYDETKVTEEGSPSDDTIVPPESIESVDTKVKDGENVDKEEKSILEDCKREREDDNSIPEAVPKKKRRGKELVNGDVKESLSTGTPPPVTVLEESEEEEEIVESDDDEEVAKPRRRGRCKKNPELIPSHLAPDIALGYRMLLKFLETPQFSGFLRPSQLPTISDPEPASDQPADTESVSEQITCLNQLKKKFEENRYKRLAEFVTDVRSMLSHVYMSPSNPAAVKRALRLEQVLEQRIAQLPNYLRPQCSLILSADEVSNSPKKIRINKGGGFVSLLLERAEKEKAEKDREKRKVLAEERKHLKEEQDKDVQDWEKNVLMKDYEEEVKSMWELPQIGHFIHLCANILNIGDVSQYEVERMLLMPQCSETLDLLITALLSNSLMRAKLDRTPSMPYSIWGAQVRTRVNAWYRAYHREYRNALKVFEEIGVEPEFWDMVGPDHSPLDYFYFHEIPLIQRVWILKTLCDVDFVRKKTVYDNIRQQLLEELQGNNLGVDRHGNRYIHFPQFGMTALRIYRQTPVLEDDLTPADLIESQEGFEERKGEITLDKVFRDIWDVGTKAETPVKRGRKKKKHKQQSVAMKVKIEPTPPKSLRQSARAKRKIYVDSTESDSSDTDLATLKNKLNKPEKTFISLSVFRLPRDKVKPANVKKSYYCRKLEREEAERLRLEELEANKDKISVDDEDASESMDRRFNEDDDYDGKDNFTVKNLQNLKMVLKKGAEDNDNATDGSLKEEEKFKYVTPANKMPDEKKFYCVVDSVDGLRQLISHFASDENDLEIINRSALKSRKSNKNKNESPSCEVQLIERLQTLVADLEAWELDFIKTSRSIREKMHKEYNNFLIRPDDFVHPNEAYWQKYYEEPTLPPPPAAEAPVPEVATPVEPTPSLSETIIPAPPSPLGGLRPRTRTRQQQQQVKVEIEFDKELDEDYEDFESSESDDNWEMPVSKRKRKKSLQESPKQILSSRPRRSPKKSTRLTYPSASESADKTKKALFWSSRSSDPSEELDWETNRQKILEKHNSPRKVLGGDIESEMTEVEDAIRTTPLGPGKSRILPPPVPGNKKPYFSNAQLKAMAGRKDDDVQIVGQKMPRPMNVTKRSPMKTARTVTKKSTSTQAAVIRIDDDPPPPPTVTTRLPTPVVHEEYFITDGSVYVKIDQSLIPELIENPTAVSQFVSVLDLNKKIQIVKKKVGGISPEYYITDGSVNIKIDESFVPELIENQNAVRKFANQLDLNKKIQIVKKKVEGTIPTPKPPLPTTTSPLRPQEPNKAPGLRFIRPQNVPQSSVQFVRTPQRMPQQNVLYLQTGVPVRPGGMPTVRPGSVVQMVARPAGPNKPQDSSSMDVVGVNQNQVGFIQMQGGKQPIQFVQVSQSPNVIGLSTAGTVGNSATPAQYVRLASSGQLLQIAPASGMTFKSNSVVTPTSAADIPASSANQVNLVQLQGMPGEPFSYIPIQGAKPGAANLVQIQNPIKGANFVQMSSASQPVQGRIVQVQGSATSPVRPQTTMVPVYQSPRMQTTMVQVYQAPRMQTTMSQMSGPRPQTVQMRTGVMPVTQQMRPLTQVAVASSGQQTKVVTMAPAQMNSTSVNTSGGIISISPDQVANLIPVSYQPGNSPKSGIISVVASSPLQTAGPRMITAKRPVGVTNVVAARATAPVRPGAPVRVAGSTQTVVQTSPRALATGTVRPRPAQTLVSLSPQALQQQQVQFSPRATSTQNTPPVIKTVPQMVSLSPQGMQQQRLIQVNSAVSSQQVKVGPGLAQLSPNTLQQNMRNIIQQKVAANSPRQGLVPTSTGPRLQRPQLIRLQMPVRAPVSTSGNKPQMVTQVVQMTGASGKPEYFQIQAPSGQSVNLVQVVSGSASNITQGKDLDSQSMVQMQATPSSVTSTNPTQMVGGTRIVQQQPQSMKPPQDIRIFSGGQSHTLRLVTSVGKPRQPVLIRSPAKPPVSASSEVEVVTESSETDEILLVESSGD